MKSIRRDLQWIGLVAVLFSLCLCQIGADLVEVNEENWENLLSSNEWMVEFYAPWCPACNRFEPVWKEFSKKSNELDIQVGAADVNANPVLTGLFSVTSLPTIYHIKDGKYRVYNGNRELTNLIDFIKNKEWEKLEPSSSWLTPNSFLIKLISVLFKISLYFKDIHTHLTEKYGLSSWVVIGIFLVITVICGLLLGVLLILLIDLICPPKHYSVEQIKEIPEDIDDDGDDKKKPNKSSDKDSQSADEKPTENSNDNEKNLKRRTGKPKLDN